MIVIIIKLISIFLALIIAFMFYKVNSNKTIVIQNKLFQNIDLYIHQDIQTYVRTFTHTYITYIQTYIHACIHAYIHTSKQVNKILKATARGNS